MHLSKKGATTGRAHLCFGAKDLAQMRPFVSVAPQLNMKTNKQISLLMGITAFCVVTSLIMCGFLLQFTHTIRSANAIQAVGAELQNVQIGRQMLFNELSEYSKRNPDILRILQPSAPLAPASAPAKPAAK
jgi:hypothetical protein